jgi:hypothetical protein
MLLGLSQYICSNIRFVSITVRLSLTISEISAGFGTFSLNICETLQNFHLLAAAKNLSFWINYGMRLGRNFWFSMGVVELEKPPCCHNGSSALDTVPSIG